TGYDATRYALAVAEAHGYGAEAGLVRLLVASMGSPWFEPLENAVDLAQVGKDQLLRAGDFENACVTSSLLCQVLLDTAPTIDGCHAEAASGLDLARRTGNEMTA